MLSDLVELSDRRVFIAIDALDECTDRSTVSKFIVELINLAPWVLFFVTSRNIPEIQESLEGLGEKKIERDLFHGDYNAHDDIECYVQAQFLDSGRLRDLRRHITDKDKKTLVASKNKWGLFCIVLTPRRAIGCVLYLSQGSWRT